MSRRQHARSCPDEKSTRHIITSLSGGRSDNLAWTRILLVDGGILSARAGLTTAVPRERRAGSRLAK
jgi:hypothetical protein